MQQLTTTYPLYTFGGEGPPLVLMLANGFPPETYQALLGPFTDDYHVVCALPRALWPDPPDPQAFEGWQTMADDLRSAVHEHGLEGALVVGHSMGAVSVMRAAIDEPDLFSGLILLDPTVLSPWMMRMLHVMVLLGQRHRYPLAQRAIHRRSEFESKQAAFDYWRRKSLFRDWDDEQLWAYVNGILHEQGEGVTLRWTPEWEAQYFMTLETMAWSWVRQLRDEVRLPMLFVQGAETDAYIDAGAEKMRRLLPDAVHARIEGHGHLFPMTAPEHARTIIQAWLNQQQRHNTC